MRTAIVGIVAWLALTACELQGPEGAPRVVEVDSSGVTIIEQSIDSARRIELVEELRLGSVGGDESQQFFRVRGASFGVDDDLWILDSGNHLVKVFGLDGTFRFSFGSQGSGPGEFQGSASTLAVGPLVVVTDLMGRMHTFEGDGSHLETVSLRGATGATVVGTPTWGGDRWLVPIEQRVDPVTREWLEPRPLTLYQVDPAAGLGAPAGFEWSMVSGTRLVGSIRWIVQPLFLQQPRYVLDGRGRVYVVKTNEYEVEVYAADGTLERRIRNHDERVPVVGDDLDAYEASRRERCPPNANPNSECVRFLDEAVPEVLAMPTPEFRAVVDRLEVSAAGDLLVLRADIDPNPWTAGDDQVHDLFDPDGRFRGRFTRPSTFRVLSLDGERLIAVERDALDVEQVVVYRIADGGI